MKRPIMYAALLLALSLSVGTAAGDQVYQRSEGGSDLLYSGATAKAERDTLYVLGGPNALNGKFQDQSGLLNWQGWTHTDNTVSGEVRWNVSDYNAPAGNYAIWCGQTGFIAPCNEGYGNDWNENLVFTYTVPNAAVATTVRLQALFNSDSEPGFDYLNVQMNRAEVWEDIAGPFDNVHVGENIDATVTFQPSDYVGAGGNQVQLRFAGTSDGAWSDGDCLYDSQGLAQVDNIRVSITGGPVFYEDFEDQDSDYWSQVFAVGVGDFAKLWSHLQDIDPCAVNSSPQVAFIDDGIVVPGTGGTPCVTWCYGPGGYIVNPNGGLAGPDSHLDNLLVSPVLTWPTGNYEGAILVFDVYMHEDMLPTSSGIDYQWHVRSTDTTSQADLRAAPWEDRNFVYYGRNYLRHLENVTDLLVPGRRLVQIGLRCLEYGWVWGVEGVDGTPAPYFDNVALLTYPNPAPFIAAREIDLAQSSFPERGTIDLAHLSNNWIRFDMARNIRANTIAGNDPGDSIYVDIGLPRAGSVLYDMPKLKFKLKYSGNPGSYPFPPALRGGLADPRLHEIDITNPPYISGWVYGDSTYQANGTLVANRYNFDLPDTGFFFPGDELHYYIEAQDIVGGNIGTATLPGNLGFFDLFGQDLGYSFNDPQQVKMIIRGLPTLFNAQGQQPNMIFWNDFGNRGGENEWYYALETLAYYPGRDYDVYYTMGPSSGVGNGLGGRATSAVLDGYDILLYTSGNLGAYTISNGDYCSDPGNDQGVLNNWFNLGARKAFFTGDDLVYSLRRSGSSGLAFVANYFNVREAGGNVTPLINSQIAPRVQTISGNSVFTSINTWLAFGGCPGINDFDALEPLAGTERLAEFLSPNGQSAYSYLAASRYGNADDDCLLMPYDFMYIYNAPGWVPPIPGRSARAQVLRDILVEFGKLPTPGNVPIDVPATDVFAVTNYPNPFNPSTDIRLTIPQAGHVSLKIYNVRGELVRTLIDGQVQTSRVITWDGTNDSGRQVASGVYFYETRYNGDVRIDKMALVK